MLCSLLREPLCSLHLLASNRQAAATSCNNEAHTDQEIVVDEADLTQTCQTCVANVTRWQHFHRKHSSKIRTAATIKYSSKQRCKVVQNMGTWLSNRQCKIEIAFSTVPQHAKLSLKSRHLHPSVILTHQPIVSEHRVAKIKPVKEGDGLSHTKLVPVEQARSKMVFADRACCHFCSPRKRNSAGRGAVPATR